MYREKPKGIKIYKTKAGQLRRDAYAVPLPRLAIGLRPRYGFRSAGQRYDRQTGPDREILRNFFFARKVPGGP